MFPEGWYFLNCDNAELKRPPIFFGGGVNGARIPFFDSYSKTSNF